MRSDDVMGKHYIPRVAAWALLRRGPAGVAVLAELDVSPDTPGAGALVDAIVGLLGAARPDGPGV